MYFNDKNRKGEVYWVVSKSNGVVHDRTCSCLNSLKPDDVEETKVLNNNGRRCSVCFVESVIRYGVRDNPEQFKSCLKFFNRVKFSNKDLNKLVLVNNAHISRLESNVLEIRVKEDTWQIRLVNDTMQLWHNNYIVKDGKRVITEGFHHQKCKSKFNIFVSKMTSYSWDVKVKQYNKAISKIEKRKRQEEMLSFHDTRKLIKDNLERVVKDCTSSKYSRKEKWVAWKYLETNYTGDRFIELKEAVNSCLSVRQIVIMLEYDYSAKQMRQIRLGLSQGISNKYVRCYADMDNGSFKMLILRYYYLVKQKLFGAAG